MHSRKSLIGRASLAWVALFTLGLSSQAATAFNSAAHVVQISIDGLGGVYLKRYLEQAPGEFPAFRRLQQQGAVTFNARCDFTHSITEPNHTCMLTGRPVAQQPIAAAPNAPHGYMDNYDPGPPWTLHTLGNPDVLYKASVLDVIHDHGRSTAFYANKQKFELFVRSYDGSAGRPDEIGADNGRNKVDHFEVLDWGSPTTTIQQASNLVSTVVAQMTNEPVDYIFLHIATTDIMGHYYAWDSPAYLEGARQVDRELGRILAAIDSTPELAGRTAIVLTADHGGGDEYGSHVQANHPYVYTIPFIVWGPTIRAGSDTYELFSNRADPGTNYVDYNANLQPIRNGDSGNLALALLGLPSIPGSFMIPELRPPAELLHLERSISGIVIWWPADSDLHLETKSSLRQTGDWTPVDQGVQVEGDRKILRISLVADSSEFFRLAK